MKKHIAIALSVLYYICVCVLCIFAGTYFANWNIFTYGYPFMVVLYFAALNNIFYKRLQIKPLVLWLWMNLAGFFAGITALTLIYPHLWNNLVMLFIIARPLAVFAALWLIVGVVFAIINVCKRKKP